MQHPRPTKARLSWLAVAALSATTLVPFAPAAAAPSRPRAAAPTLLDGICSDDQSTDFDGNGRPELAVGVPSEDRGRVAGAGAVEIRHPCSSAAAEALVLPKAHAHDGFGSALAVGAFNDDDYLDLAVGVPGLDVRGHRDAGGVALFSGSKKGLRYAKTLTQASTHVAGSVQAHARFGQTLAVYGFRADRWAVLRVGEPGRTVAGHPRAGGYVDHALVNGRYVASESGQVTLATPGVPGSPATGDAMGAALYERQQVGIPNRAVNGAAEAGAVLLTSGHQPRLITQASPGVPDAPEPGDHFGASLANDWVGAPGESVGSVADAGIVERPSEWASERVLLTQHDIDPAQVVEAGDRFGAAITEAGSVVDDVEWAPDQLLVGAPGQDVAGHADAGTVSVIGEQTYVEGPFALEESQGSLQPPAVVTGARFGAVLGRIGLRTVQVGAVGVGGGRLSLYFAPRLYDSAPALAATYEQAAGTPEPGDRYGGALVTQPS